MTPVEVIQPGRFRRFRWVGTAHRNGKPTEYVPRDAAVRILVRKSLKARVERLAPVEPETESWQVHWLDADSREIVALGFPDDNAARRWAESHVSH